MYLCMYVHIYIYIWGTLWRNWLRHCATSRKVAGSIPDGTDIILPWPWGRLRNEYQEYFPGVKAADAYGWQPYHLHAPIVLKFGSLNLIEPSGSVQACKWIPLPLYVC